jgi:hypothetical protein
MLEWGHVQNLAHPLQDIKDPIVLASRQLKPAANRAARLHPPNFAVNATTQIAIVYPHVMPFKMHDENRMRAFL